MVNNSWQATEQDRLSAWCGRKQSELAERKVASTSKMRWRSTDDVVRIPGPTTPRPVCQSAALS